MTEWASQEWPSLFVIAGVFLVLFLTPSAITEFRRWRLRFVSWGKPQPFNLAQLGRVRRGIRFDAEGKIRDG